MYGGGGYLDSVGWGPFRERLPIEGLECYDESIEGVLSVPSLNG